MWRYAWWRENKVVSSGALTKTHALNEFKICKYVLKLSFYKTIIKTPGWKDSRKEHNSLYCSVLLNKQWSMWKRKNDAQYWEEISTSEIHGGRTEEHCILTVQSTMFCSHMAHNKSIKYQKKVIDFGNAAYLQLIRMRRVACRQNGCVLCGHLYCHFDIMSSLWFLILNFSF